VGTSETLYSRPVDLFAARFFSELNELEGTAKGGAVVTPLGVFDALDYPDGTALTVSIRLQGIDIRPVGDHVEHVGIPGRVMRRRFLGEVSLVEVAVEGVDAPVKARLRETDPVRPGDEVDLIVQPRDVLVFER
jgi:iron(III) transport system ATP-binding protein